MTNCRATGWLQTLLLHFPHRDAIWICTRRTGSFDLVSHPSTMKQHRLRWAVAIAIWSTRFGRVLESTAKFDMQRVY